MVTRALAGAFFYILIANCPFARATPQKSSIFSNDRAGLPLTQQDNRSLKPAPQIKTPKHLHLFRRWLCNKQNIHPVLFSRLHQPAINLKPLPMKPILLVALSAVALLVACGISDKEKVAIQQAQQAHDDSVRTAQISQVKQADAEKVTLDDSTRTAQIAEAKKAEAEKAALNDSLSVHTALLNQEQDALVRIRTAIYTANDEMVQIKGFHFGRLPKDREAQIQAQELKIQTLLLEQTKIQSAIVQTMQGIQATKTALAVTK
jgi:major membrane immunogen (membrane-anchored lipoprotein)